MSEPITPERLRELAELYPCIPTGREYDRDANDAANMREGLSLAAAEIERLQALVDAAPVRDERAGECWCGWCCCYSGGMWDHMVGVQLRENLPRHCAKFCGNCGAELMADGTARRWVERGEQA